MRFHRYTKQCGHYKSESRAALYLDALVPPLCRRATPTCSLWKVPVYSLLLWFCLSPESSFKKYDTVGNSDLTSFIPVRSVNCSMFQQSFSLCCWVIFHSMIITVHSCFRKKFELLISCPPPHSASFWIFSLCWHWTQNPPASSWALGITGMQHNHSLTYYS